MLRMREYIAILLGVLAGLAPALWTHYTAGCFTYCNYDFLLIEGNIGLIVDYSTQIAHGTNPLTIPDVPMRYIPISLLIVLTEPFGVQPFTSTVAVSLLVEFVIVPILLYAVLRKMDYRAAILGIGLYAVTVHIVPPWAPTYWILGDWHWAMALPWFMAALHDVTSPVNYRRAGAWLGMMALTEVLMAFFAALGIGLGLLAARKWRPFVETAGASIIVGSPSFVWTYLYIDHWMSRGIQFQSWGGPWTPGLWALTITALLGTGLAIVVLRSWDDYRSWLLKTVHPSVLSSVVLLVGLTVGCLLVRAWFTRLMLGVMAKLTLYIIIPICLIGVYECISDSDRELNSLFSKSLE